MLMSFNEFIPGLSNFMEDDTVDLKDADISEEQAEISEGESEVAELCFKAQRLTHQVDMVSASFDNCFKFFRHIRENGVSREFAQYNSEMFTRLHVNIPSFESLEIVGDPNSQIAIASMEGLEDVVTGIIEFIKKVVSKVIELIGDFFRWIGNLFSGQKKAADKVFAQAQQNAQNMNSSGGSTTSGSGSSASSTNSGSSSSGSSGSSSGSSSSGGSSGGTSGPDPNKIVKYLDPNPVRAYYNKYFIEVYDKTDLRRIEPDRGASEGVVNEFLRAKDFLEQRINQMSSEEKPKKLLEQPLRQAYVEFLRDYKKLYEDWKRTDGFTAKRIKNVEDSAKSIPMACEHLERLAKLMRKRGNEQQAKDAEDNIAGLKKCTQAVSYIASNLIKCYQVNNWLIRIVTSTGNYLNKMAGFKYDPDAQFK